MCVRVCACVFSVISSLKQLQTGRFVSWVLEAVPCVFGHGGGIRGLWLRLGPAGASFVVRCDACGP